MQTPPHQEVVLDRTPRLRGWSGWRVAVGVLLAPAGMLLTGCQAVETAPPAAQVRIIAASPDAPGLDFYVHDNALAYNLGFGSVTSYIPVHTGIGTVAANTAGTKQTMAAAKGTFANANQYTVLLGNSSTELRETVLQDQTTAAPAGQIALRVLHQATRMGALDLYLVPAGRRFAATKPLLTNLTSGNAASYLNVPTGTYTLVMVPAGTVPAVATYTGAQVEYPSGSATTVVLLDQQSGAGVQVISATDYLPPVTTN